MQRLFHNLLRRTQLVLFLAVCLTALPPAAAQEVAAKPARFESAIAAFEEADRTNPPPAGGTLFVGASNIRRWKSLPDRFKPQPLNRGFGGSHLSDVLHFSDRIILPYAPKTIYINAGGNDLHAGKSPESVAATFEQLVQKIRQALPDSKVAYIAIPPSPRRWEEVDRVKQANELIQEIASRNQVEFIDIFPLLLGADGTPRKEFYVDDQLHFSERGYDVVTSAIRWQKAVENLERIHKQNPPPSMPILFIGSSSIVRWKSLATDFPDLPVMNCGFGGSDVFDSLTYAHRLVLPFRPKMVVMYAGGNDINRGKTPERVASDFRDFVERIHKELPQTRVAYISIAGNPARWSQVDRVRDANKRIEEFTKSARLSFIDAFSNMLGPDGLPLPDLFVADRLHMNENGYALWKKLVRPYLDGEKGTESGKE